MPSAVGLTFSGSTDRLEGLVQLLFIVVEADDL